MVKLGKQISFEVRPSVQILILPFTTWITLGMFLNFSESQFPNMQNGGKPVIYHLAWLGELKSEMV